MISKVMNTKPSREYFIHLNAIEKFNQSTKNVAEYFKWRIEMKKRNIIVYDYSSSVKPIKYEVEAHCVGGENGVRAYFILNEKMYEAQGDDGHWWLVGKISKSWIKEIIDTISSLYDSIEKE
jgi:hypothetical protein